MAIQSLRSYRSAVSIALSLGLVMLPAISTQAQVTSEKTATVPNNHQSLEFLLEINFDVDNEDERQPEESVGAGSRDSGQCGNETEGKPLTLLVPGNAVPLTVAERPTFFVYFPDTVAEAAEFSLRDERGNGIYQTTFDLSATSGITRVQMPDSSPGLEIGQTYQWSVAMICDPGDRLRDRVVDASIERIEPTEQLTRQLENANIPEKVAIYAQSGIWYDTVSTLANLWSESEGSTIAINAWKRILTSEFVQLDEMLGVPLIQPRIQES